MQATLTGERASSALWRRLFDKNPQIYKIKNLQHVILLMMAFIVKIMLSEHRKMFIIRNYRKGRILR